jgi:hypothetical protein
MSTCLGAAGTDARARKPTGVRSAVARNDHLRPPVNETGTARRARPRGPRSRGATVPRRFDRTAGTRPFQYHTEHRPHGHGALLSPGSERRWPPTTTAVHASGRRAAVQPCARRLLLPRGSSTPNLDRAGPGLLERGAGGPSPMRRLAYDGQSYRDTGRPCDRV